MKTVSLLISLIFIIQVNFSIGICDIDYNLQIEDGIWSTPLTKCNPANSQIACIESRSAATNDKVAHVATEGQGTSYIIVSESRCDFNVINLRYSNDGPSDIISIYLDNDRIGKVVTDANSESGRAWNDFKQSGLVGNTQVLDSGIHNLTIIVGVTDGHGVELDEIEVSFMMCVSDCPMVIPFQQSLPDEEDTSENAEEPTSTKEKSRKLEVLAIIFGAFLVVLTVIIFILSSIWIFKKYKCLQCEGGPTYSDLDGNAEHGSEVERICC